MIQGCRKQKSSGQPCDSGEMDVQAAAWGGDEMFKLKGKVTYMSLLPLKCAQMCDDLYQ